MASRYHDYQDDVYRLDRAACRYPNFAELLRYHPYGVGTFAGFADITPDLLLEAVRGNEELTAGEIFKCAKYSGIPLSVLICPKMITLDRGNRRHRDMMDQLRDKLHVIGEWQEKGSKEADWYMNAEYTDCGLFVRTEMQFRNGATVTYGRYLGIRKRMDDVIIFAAHEFRPASRGLNARMKAKG